MRPKFNTKRGTNGNGEILTNINFAITFPDVNQFAKALRLSYFGVNEYTLFINIQKQPSEMFCRKRYS